MGQFCDQIQGQKQRPIQGIARCAPGIQNVIPPLTKGGLFPLPFTQGDQLGVGSGVNLPQQRNQLISGIEGNPDFPQRLIPGGWRNGTGGAQHAPGGMKLAGLLLQLQHMLCVDLGAEGALAKGNQQVFPSQGTQYALRAAFDHGQGMTHGKQ